MNLEVFDIIIFISGVALGIIAGLAIKKGNQSATKSSINGAQSSVDSIQFEIERKQSEIDTFFTETNEKLLSTEKAMRNLKQQLASGAASLATSNMITQSIDTDSTESNSIDNNTPAEPPKDYSINASGTLSEDFGLQSKDNEAQEQPLRS
ncbi:ZapG family protein [Marinomonas algicola]|jgi:uncharacterized protein|uniref:ZapG family protein n=1 Tax=Marinomonas algicola TaxID=2773454 RepID=UPI00174D9D63|nr:DUF1043 family protein [Marinomonas algicola]